MQSNYLIMDSERRKRIEEFYRQWNKELDRIKDANGTPPKLEIFERMAWELSRVPFKEVYVDVSYKRHTIDFDINTGIDKVHFSCSVYEEVWDEDRDVCFAAISRDSETLVVNAFDLTHFVDKMLEILEDLTKLQQDENEETVYKE